MPEPPMDAKRPGAAGQVLRMTRLLNAPRELVFEAFTTAAALEQWWGPRGVRAEIEQLDVRTGGTYRFAKHFPDGRVFRVTGTYLEVRRPERLVFSWRWLGEAFGPDETIVTIELHDRPPGTQLVLTHSGFTSAEARDQHRHGWESSFDKLVETLATAPEETS